MLKRILVLDDSQDVLDLIKEALSDEQFEVNITSNSKDIMESVTSLNPDLVILDYKITGPKGDDICRRIKAHPLVYNTPVIICSAYIKEDELFACGCDAIISKPFGLDELIYKVTNLVYGDRPSLPVSI